MERADGVYPDSVRLVGGLFPLNRFERAVGSANRYSDKESRASADLRQTFAVRRFGSCAFSNFGPAAFAASARILPLHLSRQNAHKITGFGGNRPGAYRRTHVSVGTDNFCAFLWPIWFGVRLRPQPRRVFRGPTG